MLTEDEAVFYYVFENYVVQYGITKALDPLPYIRTDSVVSNVLSSSKMILGYGP